MAEMVRRHTPGSTSFVFSGQICHRSNWRSTVTKPPGPDPPSTQQMIAGECGCRRLATATAAYDVGQQQHLPPSSDGETSSTTAEPSESDWPSHFRPSQSITKDVQVDSRQ
ncbi:hypothetical protein ACLOJK_027123 [Asimina triloba]